MIEINYTNKFGDTLFGNAWEIENKKAIVLIVTGMAEHSGRYNDFAEYLNRYGMSCYCLDHYGQGKNGQLGRPGKDYFAKMVETMREFINLKKEANPGLPIYIFAHSMGTFITQGFLEKYSNIVDKIVLCGSNYLGKGMTKTAELLAKMIVNKKNYDKDAKLLHNLALGPCEKKCKTDSVNAWISYNPENVKRYDEDPLSGFRCSNGFFLEFFHGLNSIHNKKALKKVSQTLKVKIIGGDGDPVSKNGKQLETLYKVYKKAGINVSLHIYDDMRHEILNEVNRDIVFRDVKNFFNE